MQKEYFNNLINEEINLLIERKDSLCEEIVEVATYLDFNESDITLGRLDIGAINDKRQQMYAIYELIAKLESLKIRESE